jgi:vitamin B12 transporter
VPLSRVAFSSIDVGSLDLGSYDRVDVYRGGVPVDLGGAVLGGAVDFQTTVGPRPDGSRNQIVLGGGSFGARRLRLVRGDAWGDGRLKTTFGASYAGATGDFDYFDDNGTPLNPADDSTRKRSDDGFDAVDLVARVHREGDPDVTGGARFSYKDQGVPGPTGAHATATSLTTTRGLGDVQVRLPRLADGLALSTRGYVLVEGQHYLDPKMEVGLTAADTSYLTVAGGATVAAALVLGEHQRLSAALEGRVEHFTQNDNTAADPQDVTGRRFGVAFGVADEIVLGIDEAWVVVPAVRLDVLATRGDGPPSPVIDFQAPAPRDDVYASPRLGARFRAADALTFKGNIGRTFRAPTIIELFGDRGFVGGNPNLRPETGTTGDIGLVVAPAQSHGFVDRLYLEVAVFGAVMSDLIAFLPTSGRIARAQNLADAHLGGVEVALAARFFRTLSLTGNYTLLGTEQVSAQVFADGKNLPGRPRHDLYLRADVSRRLGPSRVTLGGFADLTYVSGNFLDSGNLEEVPARRFVGVGVDGSPFPGLVLTVQVKNLFDERVETVASAVGPISRAVADVLDYPLPGRAFYAAADCKF